MHELTRFFRVNFIPGPHTTAYIDSKRPDLVNCLFNIGWIKSPGQENRDFRLFNDLDRGGTRAFMMLNDLWRRNFTGKDKC